MNFNFAELILQENIVFIVHASQTIGNLEPVLLISTD